MKMTPSQLLTGVCYRGDDEGEVRLKRRDGQVFVVKPDRITASPLDIEGIDLDITVNEIVDFIAEGRRYS